MGGVEDSGSRFALAGCSKNLVGKLGTQFENNLLNQ